MKFRYIVPFLLLALLLPCSARASLFPPTGDYEHRMSETFNISRDGRVRLDNRYGEIKVKTWDQSKVKIDVLIRISARSEEEFKKVLQRIDVSLSGSGSTVSAITSIDSNTKGQSWWSYITGGSSTSSDYKIYYTVNMPATVNLDTEARYCDVELPNLSGETRVDVAYGDLVAGRLTGRSEVEVSYGSARIEQLGNASTFKIRYSEGTIRNAANLRYDGRYSETRMGKVGKVDLDIGYEEVEIESADEVRLDGNYNEFSIDRVNRIYLDGSYCDYDIGTVTKVVEMDGNYAEIEIDDLQADFERVSISTSYTDVDINVADDAGYSVDLRSRYGDIDINTNNLSPRNVDREGTSESVTGKKAGRGNGTIKISTNYGDIEIY